MTNFENNYYSALGLKDGATLKEVKIAYRDLVKKYHPDLNPDNKDFEMRIREINEAYEVIGNHIEKEIYDQYRARPKKLEKVFFYSPNKKRYTKETQIKSEIRTYIKGNITIKYRGLPTENNTINILREAFYKMLITDVKADIQNSDISVAGKIPKEFETIFKSTRPLELNIQTPIECRIFDGENVHYYDLDIQGITLPHPEIDKVTKHEAESFGTLKGIFYGYVCDFQIETIKETVTECSGETGRKEIRFEGGIEFYRKEYFHTNCTIQWGPWLKREIYKTYVPTGKVENNGSYFRNQYYYNNYKSTYWGKWNYKAQHSKVVADGCFSSFVGWLSIILFAGSFIAFFPSLFFLFPFIAIPLLIRLLPMNVLTWLARLIWVSFICLYLFGIVSLFSSSKKDKESLQNDKKTAKSSSVVKSTAPKTKKATTIKRDSTITKHLEWEDYSQNHYSGAYSIKVSDLNASSLNKNNIPFEASNQQHYNKIIYELKEFDKNRMVSIYKMFDSLQINKPLNRKALSECIVSFVQAIPYSLILPDRCDASLYQDGFTYKYLSSPNARCEGNERFGINSPIEFLAKLKGDCDTRTLLLYTILSYYKYDVILLSSSHYGHSLIGINLPYQGLCYSVENSNYFLWETTSSGARPGVVSSDISDLNHWTISLKSK